MGRKQTSERAISHIENIIEIINSDKFYDFDIAKEIASVYFDWEITEGLLRDLWDIYTDLKYVTSVADVPKSQFDKKYITEGLRAIIKKLNGK